MKLERLKILHIEDDSVFRELVARTLSYDYTVKAASTLAKGLHLLANEYFDVVLLDLILPDSPATETLAKLRKHWPGPVVVASGLDSHESNVVCVTKEYLGRASLLKSAIKLAMHESNTTTMIKEMSAPKKPKGLNLTEKSRAACLMLASSFLRP